MSKRKNKLSETNFIYLFKKLFSILLIIFIINSIFFVNAESKEQNLIYLDSRFDSIGLNLDQKIAEAKPELIVTVDEFSVAVFVKQVVLNGRASQFVLVDHFDSYSGSINSPTPEGFFNVYPMRMKENDYSWTYKVPLQFTVFWQDYDSKKFKGYGFHGAQSHNIDKIGISCISKGCVNLRLENAKKLFNEIKNNFSKTQKGDQVLIVSKRGINSNLPKPSELLSTFRFESSYLERQKKLLDDERSNYSRFLASFAKAPLAVNDLVFSEMNSPYFAGEKILLDLRKPLGGNGDTASGMFILQNIFASGFNDSVDVMVDEKSLKIFKNIAKGLSFFDKVRLLEEEDLTEKVYSLIIRSGQPSGRQLITSLSPTNSLSETMPGKINTDSSTIYFSLTILGNTFNRHSVQPLSLVSVHNKYYLLPSLGMAISRSPNSHLNSNNLDLTSLFIESGLFRDPFSVSIKDLKIDDIESLLISEDTGPDLNKLLNFLFLQRKTRDIKYGLAYGFSISQVRSQARSYFKSFLNHEGKTVLLTPSNFSEKLLNSFSESERSQISVVKLLEISNLESNLLNKKLTIIQIPNVSHRVFSSLLLASYRNGIVTLGAGDGFFTTALSLGVPFVPTVVEWNIRNIRNLARILNLRAMQKRQPDVNREKLRQVFSPIPNDPIDLSKSQSLHGLRDLFAELINYIPDPMAVLDQTVKEIRSFKDISNSLGQAPGDAVLFSEIHLQTNDVNARNQKYGETKECLDFLR